MTRFSENFRAALAEPVTTLCHCWRLERRDGVVFGFTDHDRALEFGGVTFAPESGFSASEAKSSLGFGASRAEVEGALASTAIDEADIDAGLYDGARVETFLVNWRKPDEHGLLRVAHIGRIVRSDGSFVAELESPMAALDQPEGRFITRRCDAELGDRRCGVALDGAVYRAEATVLAADPLGIVHLAGLEAFDAGWFASGTLVWGAGNLARVREHRSGNGFATLVLEDGASALPAVGDAVSVTAGCDKSFGTCRAKFGNGLNFRGFPHLPGNDRAYEYVSDGAVFDGGALVP
ncbi:MAG: DUF2163 domain-containing protein [Methylobacterium mesophilicum]|nr:DUF2163 domain-containing protein [Methylobacterium mesophilicum]